MHLWILGPTQTEYLSPLLKQSQRSKSMRNAHRTTDLSLLKSNMDPGVINVIF